MKSSRFFKVAVFFVMLFPLLGCQSAQTRIDHVAIDAGFKRSTINVNGFELTIYKHHLDQTTDTLSVYLEGDGTPWRYRYFVMADPTGSNPLMLKLMAQDTQPSVYLGRPCYHGNSNDSACNDKLWTSARYSPTVVNAMGAALRVLIKQHKVKKVRLFGHSGGAALALLLAANQDKVVELVTVAGNLDTDGWTKLHGYTPLYSSLNPAKQPKLRASVVQWHLLGTADAVIPAQLSKPFVLNQTNAWGLSLPGFTHGCCWLALWPEVLRAVRSQSPKRLNARLFKQPDSN